MIKLATQIQKAVFRIGVPGLISIVIGCAPDQPGPTGTPLQVSPSHLSVREGAVDTARFTPRFRMHGGGGVFITLTGEPSVEALTALQNSGAAAAPGRSHMITFDSLKIRTVWAHLSSKDIEKVARLPFVARVESSDDIDSIMPDYITPPINTTASDIRWNLLKVRAPDIWRDFQAAGMNQVGYVGVTILDEGGDCRLASPAANWQFLSASCGNNYTTDQTPVYLGQHGTDVGSFIAGEPDNLWGAGVAPRVHLTFVKVLPSGSDWGSFVQGLNDAYARGDAVVNMSLGNCGALPPSTVQTAISQFTTRTPTDAANPGQGVSLVAAAGNGIYSPGCNNTLVQYPAAYSEVIAVAAIDSLNNTMTGLSAGPKVELSAPGICVDGLLVGGGADPCITGTSFSAPHVAGLIALLRAEHRGWGAATVRQQLINTATKISGQALPRDNRFGYGIVNAYPLVAPTPFTTSITGPTSVRPNALCTYVATTRGGGDVPFTWLWGPGGQTVSTLDLRLTGFTTLTVTITDAHGQTASASKSVSVSSSAPICNS